MSSGYAPPPWQAPPRRPGGWGDPRFSQPQHTPAPQQQQYQHQHTASAQSPISPINPQAFAYHPPDSSQAGPLGGPSPYRTQHDTSTWGVKYNQNQSQGQQWQVVDEQPPALPPRPTSTTGTLPQHSPPPSAGQWQNYDTVSTGPPQQTYLQQQPSSWPNAYDQQPVYGQSVPPPPPPKPPVYEQTSQQYSQQAMPHDQYSHHLPTHHYEPQSQSSKPPVPYDRYTASPGPVQDVAPVSPIDPGPNRWQNPQTAPPPPFQGGNIQSTAHNVSNQFYSTALGPYGVPSDWEHFGDESAASPEVSSPTSDNANPAVNEHTLSSLPPKGGSTVDPQPPPNDHPPRRDSKASSAVMQGIRRTDTIDGVIESWTAPLKVASNPGVRADEPPRSQDSHLRPTNEKIVEVVKEVTKIVDPYEDLQPEVKASLKRYADMLRKEAAAETDEEKFAAFEAFIKKELRLRAMLYGMDSPLQLIKTQDKPALPAGVSKSATSEIDIAPPPVPVPSPAILTDEPKMKAEVVVPKPQSPPLGPPVAPIITGTALATAKSAPSTDSKPKVQSPISGPSMTRVASMLKDSPVRESPAKEDSFVMVGADEGEAYSPGGRPLVKKPTEEAYSPGGRPIVPNSQAASSLPRVPGISIPTIPQNRGNLTSPGVNAPMVLEDYITPGLPSPGANAPMLVEPPTPSPTSASANAPIPLEGSGSKGELSKRSSNASSLKFEPQRPVYTPFRYNPAVEAPLLPADRSYSSLRKDGAESGRFLKHDVKPATPSTPASGLKAPGSLQPANKMQAEAFIGLIRQQSMAVRKNKPNLDAAPPLPSLRPGTPARTSSPAVTTGRAATVTPIAALRPGTPAIANDVQSAVVALRAVLPESVPDGYGLSVNENINAVKSQLDLMVDQFAYIHQTVVDWDQRNRKIRKRLDDERNARQADSEARIDDMFNDNEIGYADIGELEAEFKLGEARLKYDEDKEELDSFTQHVYEVVTGRLQSELAELNRLYTTAVDLLDLESEPASRCLKLSSHQVSNTPEMGWAMNLALSAFNKIELRQQKIAEAKVERERRRKRLELTVLYTNGDTSGVKSLEAEFAVAEKMQVLHEARARDARANKLMDHFDRATVRGLGDNQNLVDELLPKVKAVRDMVLRDPSIRSGDDSTPAAPSGPQTNESLYGPAGVHSTLYLTQSIIDLLLLDSQKLLTISNVADKLLNDADYSVSVAEARVSNADATVYARLKEEKEKEDDKIVEDTQGRMAAIGKGPGEAAEMCREVGRIVGEDEGHGGRVGRALAEAKMRNQGQGS